MFLLMWLTLLFRRPSKLHISFQITQTSHRCPVTNNIQTDSVKRGKQIGLNTCVDVASGILAISKFDGRNVLRRDINSKVWLQVYTKKEIMIYDSNFS